MLTTQMLCEIDRVHNRKKLEINSDRDAAMGDMSAVVVVDDIEYQADPASKALINDVLTTFSPLGSLPDGYQWIAADNSRHVVTLQKLAHIAVAIEERKRKVWFEARDRKDRLQVLMQDLEQPDILDLIAYI